MFVVGFNRNSVYFVQNYKINIYILYILYILVYKFQILIFVYIYLWNFYLI